jgi:amidohydrolase
MTFRAAAQQLLPRITAWRRALHQIPEVGLDLPLTRAFIRNELGSLGLTPRPCADGLVVDLGSGTDRLAFRADMDALPVEEANETPFRSQHPGAMHACGHDAHVATLLGLAAILTGEPRADRPVRLIFQPGEEGYFGAREMLAAGALDGVSAVFATHVGAISPEVGPGQVGVKPGPCMAAADEFTIRLVGKGAHVAMPHDGRDPVYAGSLLVQAVQALTSRESDPTRPAIVSISTFHAGTAHNIIPETAELSGTIRTVDEDDRGRLARRLEEVAKALAAGLRLDAEIALHQGYPATVNDERLSRLVTRIAREGLGPDAVRVLASPSMGGEDMSYFLEKVPGVLWFLGTQNPGKGICAPQHSSRFDVDEDLLWIPVWLHREIIHRFDTFEPEPA